MSQIDLPYLCASLGNLSGLPVRLFSADTLVYYHSVVDLPADPYQLYQEKILQIREHVGHFITGHFHYYGIVNSGPWKIVIGPSRQIVGDDRELRELAFRLDLRQEKAVEFVRKMKSLIPMPLESILQIMCTINHVLNGEKTNLQNISIYDSQQQDLIQQITSQRSALELVPSNYGSFPHNTYGQEQSLMQIVRQGDVAALDQWVRSAPAIRGGILASQPLRQMKNTFIVTATLASRSAIEGGMDVEESYGLSDSYIQKAEFLDTPDRITNLQFHMVQDYTERVNRIRIGNHTSRLTADVANYVQKHISQRISTEEMAKALFVSRTHLSRRFREETGQTLTDYILNEKTEEAKRLLRYTNKSLTAISDYLAFSSQGHFARVFHKYAGCTPRKYREHTILQHPGSPGPAAPDTPDAADQNPMDCQIPSTPPNQ